MSRKPRPLNRQQQDFEITIRRNELISENVTVFIRVGVIGFVVCFCVYYINQSVISLAGRATNADIVISFFTSISVNKWVAYSLAVLGVGYGMNERRLRKKHIQRSSRHQKELETKLNPKRRTSGLTERGDTHPED